MSVVSKNTKWGIINSIGDIVLPFVYSSIKHIGNEGFLAVNKGGSLIEYTEETHGVAGVGIKGGKWAIFNADGKQITEFLYDNVLNLYGGIIVVFKGKMGAINLKGEKVIDFIYDQMFSSKKDNFFIVENMIGGIVRMEMLQMLPDENQINMYLKNKDE